MRPMQYVCLERSGVWLHLARCALLVSLLAGASRSVFAQAPAAAVAASPVSALPQAPSTPGSLSGEVVDPTGALIPRAHILLRPSGHQHDREVASDDQGHFLLGDLQPGEYSFLVTAPGFEPFASVRLTLQPGEAHVLPAVTLHLPADHADAYVTMNRREIASAELHAAEQQRIVGFPDFYTSFVWDAAPLDARQKLSLGLHATTDRMAFVTAALVASGEQINNTFPEFGKGADGFGKRYGAAYADGFTGKFLGGALLPALFRQDPRYFYMGASGTLKQRVRHAVASAFLARGDDGKTELNYSHILGNASAGAISTLYHPASDSAGKLALDNALLGTVGEAGVNVVRELFLKRFVRGGDVSANGMP